VPDEFLWRVPFEALIGKNGEFLVAERAIAYAPSTTMLAWSERRRASRARHTLLALGDPQLAVSTRRKAATYRNLAVGALPDAAREARALYDLYGRRNSTLLTGAAAREASFKKLARDYRIVHLATHGIVDDESPQYSALVLARAPGDDEDGLLEMREVRGLDLHADLVVLSACDTASGRFFPGEGVISLSWAFLTAGCPTTVVSQWKTESATTEKLMTAFHRRLLAGDTKAEALRKAKLALLRDPQHGHPFYWAPFVVIGAP
jgi:CHAT domain-containing protein